MVQKRTATDTTATSQEICRRSLSGTTKGSTMNPETDEFFAFMESLINNPMKNNMNENNYLTDLVESEAYEVDGYPSVRRVFIEDYKDALHVLKKMTFVNDDGSPCPKVDEIHNDLKRGSGRLLYGTTLIGPLLGSFVLVFQRDNDPRGARHAFLHLFVTEEGQESEIMQCTKTVYSQYKQILDGHSHGGLN
jgi:hypothetical protein